MQHLKIVPQVVFLVAFTSLLAACGGGGGGGGASPAPSVAPSATANQSAAGLWQTTYQVTSGTNAGDTIQASALIASTGQYYFLSVNQTNHCAEVGFGTASVSGTTIKGSGSSAVVTYAPGTSIVTTCQFPDGSTSATDTYAGTVAQGASLVLSGASTTALGTVLPPGQTVTLNFNPAFNQGASLAAVAGTYVASSGAVLTISPTGSVAATNSATGCSLSGTVAIPNSSQDVYQLALTESGCTGVNQIANGASLSGLAYLDTSVNPNQLVAGVSAKVSGQTLVLVDALKKQ